MKTLTEASLEQMLIQMRTSVDSMGKTIALRPKKLVVQRRYLRTAMFVLYSKYTKRIGRGAPRKLRRIAKRNALRSFSTPRWVI